jgi:hypothetical protein
MWLARIALEDISYSQTFEADDVRMKVTDRGMRKEASIIASLQERNPDVLNNNIQRVPKQQYSRNFEVCVT